MGIGTAALRIRSSPWDGDPGGKVLAPGSAGAPRAEGTPIVEVKEEEYDFGTQDAKAPGRHEFVITSVGQAPLKLTKGETSCKCTVSELEKDVLEPGESVPVVVTWNAADYVGKFRQSATILTNDTARPQLTFVITGHVTTAVRVVPSELVFTSVALGESSTAEAPIYCYLDEPFQVVGFKLSDQDIAKYFEVTFEPLPEEMLKKEDRAKSGQLAKVTVKPGLPPGRFHQRILIRTNLEASSSLTIPIEGKVSSDIDVVGPGWDSERDVLFWGEVDSHQGDSRRLLLIARGPDRKQVKFTVSRVSPEFLKVNLGEMRDMGSSASQVPLTIEIPKGTRPGFHAGGDQGELGEILLQTGHPRSPKVRVRVSVIVKG